MYMLCPASASLVWIAVLLAAAYVRAVQESTDSKLCKDTMGDLLHGYLGVIQKGDDAHALMDKFFADDMVGEYPSFVPQTKESLGKFFAAGAPPSGCGIQVHMNMDRVLAHNNKALIKDAKDLRVACSISFTMHYVIYSTEEVMEPCVFSNMEQLSTRINPATGKMEVFNDDADGAKMQAGLGACFARCAADASASPGHEASDL